MQAIVYTEYGAPDVLRLEDVAKPTPKDDEVLVRVHAASANPLDWHFMRGAPFLARLEGGLQKPKNPRLGADIAGRVEAVGSGVTRFKPGDEVFGDLSGNGLGGFAEYATALENKLALKPPNISFEQAAAVPVAAITALQGLRDMGKIRAGQTVLVNGASGGVGSFAVQIAKSFGTEVTGVCSTRNLELVRSMGADHVIDYTKEDFTKSTQRYDLIFDTVGNLSVGGCRRALNENGICSVAGFTTMGHLFGVMLLGGLVSATGSRKVQQMGTAQPNSKDLSFLSDLLEKGKIIPVIDRSYPLSETAEAIRYLETGRARGKVIVTVA
ncbi:MAG: NAD(P)-dependent alcohol dehydrogenase [Chloroflexota bacterium]